MLKYLISAVLACSLVGVAAAKTSSPTLRDKQQAACATDAQKLCASSMPDVDKVTACMATKRAQVSPACAAMYDVKHHRAGGYPQSSAQSFANIELPASRTDLNRIGG